MPLPRLLADDDVVHLTRPVGAVAPRRKGVRGHQRALGGDDVVRVGSLPVTSPARTWLDLAMLLSPDDMVVAGDFLDSEHRRGFGLSRDALVRKDSLDAYLRAHPGRRGVKRARRALELVRIGVDSPPETRLRLVLERSHLPGFLVNCPVSEREDELPVWTDLGCPEYRTCVEYEGPHHLGPERQAADRRRDQRVRHCGWQQVKIYARDMALGPQWVVSLVEQGLIRAGWRPPSHR